MAAWITAMLSRSSVGPSTPDMPMHPSASGNTAGPLDPSWRSSGCVVMPERYSPDLSEDKGLEAHGTDTRRKSYAPLDHSRGVLPSAQLLGLGLLANGMLR